MVGKHADLAHDVRILGRHGATIAKAAQIFRREKAEDSCIAHGAQSLVLVKRALSLSAVFDEQELMTFGNGQHGVHVHGLTI